MRILLAAIAFVGLSAASAGATQYYHDGQYYKYKYHGDYYHYHYSHHYYNHRECFTK